MANRMYSETPEPRFVEAAKAIIPNGVASGTPVDIEKIAANTVPDPVAGKVLIAKTSSGKTVMEWGSELPAAPEGASAKTFNLQLVNGVLTWTEVV